MIMTMNNDTLELAQRDLSLQLLEVDMPVEEAFQEEAVYVEMSDDQLLSEIESILDPAILNDPEFPQTMLEEQPPIDEIEVNSMRFDMGKELIGQGYYYQARDIYSDLSKCGFREYESLVRLGTAQRMLGDVADSAMSLNRALAIRTDCAEAWHQLGLLMMGSERPMLNEAKAFLRQAFRINPDDSEISSDLLRCEMMVKGYTA